MEKINVYVPLKTGITLDNDATLFEILKHDGISINRNRFLSMLIVGYYNDYINTCQDIITAIRRILSVNISDPESCNSAAEQILTSVILPDVPKRKGKSPKKLSLKPTEETEGIINKIIESLGANDYVSQYFCRMFMSYCEKPLYERERIVFKNSYEFLNTACLLNRPITFSTIWNKREIHEVLPYEVVVGQDEMFNYLLCQEKDRHTGRYTARTYRLNRISKVNYSSASSVLSAEVARHLELMKEYGAQYLIYDEEETCVKLSDYGMIQFNRIYQGRPKYERIETQQDGHYFFFKCSKDQIFFYFRRYEAGAAEIIYPESLRDRVIEFHKKIIDDYEEKQEKGNGQFRNI